MKKYKAVLFDYDGTLMDTNRLIINSWQHMGKVIGNVQFSFDDIASTFGIPLEPSIDGIAKKYGITNYSLDELVSIYRGYQTEHRENLGGLFPGILSMLEELKDKGYLLGVVTSRANKPTADGLEQYGALEYFDAIIGADDTNTHKPEPEPCLLCCGKLGVSPSEAIMAGDSRFDIACANNAGAGSIFVEWSFCTDRDALTGEYKPTYIAKTPRELSSLF